MTEIIKDKLRSGRILTAEQRAKILDMIKSDADGIENATMCPRCDKWREPWTDGLYFCPSCLPRVDMWVHHPEEGDLWPCEHGRTPAGYQSMVDYWERAWRRKHSLSAFWSHAADPEDTDGFLGRVGTPDPEHIKKMTEAWNRVVDETEVKLDGGIARVCGMDPTQSKGGAK